MTRIENMARQKRGTCSTKFNITGFEQNMPQVNNWQDVLNDNEQEDQLLEIIKQYVLEFGSEMLPRLIPFIITLREKEYILFRLQEIKLLHGSKVESDVAVVYKGADVLILMTWAYPKSSIRNNWYLQYNHERFPDMRIIYSYSAKNYL